jgi:hypothetical protein
MYGGLRLDWDPAEHVRYEREVMAMRRAEFSVQGATDDRTPRERPSPRSADEMLAGACDLLRESGRHAAIAAVILMMLAVGVVNRLVGGGPYGPGGPPVHYVLLAVVSGLVLWSAVFVVWARRTLRDALARVRSRIGAPLDPGVPWTPAGVHASLDGDIVAGELRRLLGAAHRCCDLASRAEELAAAAGVLFLFWTLAGTG